MENEEYIIPAEEQENISFWLTIFHHSTSSIEDPAEAIRVLKEYSVVGHRRMALESFRIAFQTTPIGNWVKSHPETHENLFPRFIEVTIAEFMSAFTVNDENAAMISFLHQFMLGWLNGKLTSA